MTIMSSYSISGTNVRVECEDNWLTRRVIGAIDDFFMTRDGITPDSHGITLRFKNNDFSIKASEKAQQLYVSSSLRVLRDGDFYYLIGEDSLFQFDLRSGIGMGLLDPSFWERSTKSKQDFLMLSLLWLLRPHGLYVLHANGLVRDNIGILFVGSSGSGKSTLSLSLIRRGWGYLSDDVILIKHHPDGVGAIAFQRGFSFDLNLANHYPELNKPLESFCLNGQKRFLDIDFIYPDRFKYSCFPNVLIFPNIVSQEKSQLIPIDRAKALILLIENSGGIMVDKEMVVKQMGVLKRLVYQTSSYQLLAGRDLYEEPERIYEIISGVNGV
jgi:hypothetical protein